MLREIKFFNCRWCKGTTVVGDGPKDKPDWTRIKCSNCGAISYKKLPSQTDLELIYASAWMEPSVKAAFAVGTTDSNISSSLLDAVGWNKSDGLSLDYGAGLGLLSSQIVARGGRVLALEPHGQEGLCRDASTVTWVKSVDEIPLGTKFDWVFLIEVIEHMLDPVSELKKIRNLMHSGGKLFITTPNARGWRAKKDGFKWREAQNPTHIFLFTKLSLVQCLFEAGFEKSLRINKSVDYGKKGIFRLALSMSQKLGIDGGLRFTATK